MSPNCSEPLKRHPIPRQPPAIQTGHWRIPSLRFDRLRAGASAVCQPRANARRATRNKTREPPHAVVFSSAMVTQARGTNAWLRVIATWTRGTNSWLRDGLLDLACTGGSVRLGIRGTGINPRHGRCCEPICTMLHFQPNFQPIKQNQPLHHHHQTFFHIPHHG